MKRIGFFGGTFDPIHFGHLNLALSIFEQNQLDQVFFSPANFSPAKGNIPPSASGEDRKKMVELAILNIPYFSVVDLEINRQGPSYTIETIERLVTAYEDAQFYLILGEDTLSDLPKWKNIGKLLELAPPLVAESPYTLVLEELKNSQFYAKIEAGKTFVPRMDISSTIIRERLKRKMYCEHLVPAKVLDYIRQKRLY